MIISKTEELILKCNICDNKNISELLDYKKFYLKECKKCDFYFSNKIPNINMINECYSEYDRSVTLSDNSIKNIEVIVNRHIKKYDINNVLDIGCGNGEFLDLYKKFRKETYFFEFGDNLIN